MRVRGTSSRRGGGVRATRRGRGSGTTVLWLCCGCGYDCGEAKDEGRFLQRRTSGGFDGDEEARRRTTTERRGFGEGYRGGSREREREEKGLSKERVLKGSKFF
jgi:hypothetical protein